MGPGTALKRATAYFESRGYRRVADDPDGARRFERGRPMAALYVLFDVRKLRTSARLSARQVQGGTQLTLRYDVETLGWVVTETNRRYWDIEVEDLCDNVRQEAPAEDRWERYDDLARLDNRRFVLVSLGIATSCFLLVLGLGRLL